MIINPSETPSLLTHTLYLAGGRQREKAKPQSPAAHSSPLESVINKVRLDADVEAERACLSVISCPLQHFKAFCSSCSKGLVQHFYTLAHRRDSRQSL